MSTGPSGVSSFSPCSTTPQSLSYSSVYLQGLVDEWCVRTGRPLFGPRPDHVCDRDCVVLGSWPHQVCALSRIEHHCGGLGIPKSGTGTTTLKSGTGATTGFRHFPDRPSGSPSSGSPVAGCCQCSHLVTTSEGSVCSFSGRVLSGPSESVSTFGDSHWGSGVRRKSVSSGRSVDFSSEVQSGVEYFLSGSTRWSVWRQEKERLLGACVRSGKSQRPRYRGRSSSAASLTTSLASVTSMASLASSTSVPPGVRVPSTTSAPKASATTTTGSGPTDPGDANVPAPAGLVRVIPTSLSGTGSSHPPSPADRLPPSREPTPVSSESTHLFRESVLIVDGHFRERRSSLSLPVRPSPWLRTLSEKILDWWKTVSRICPDIKSPSSSGVLPFVGTVLSFLGSPRGLVVGGVTLIQPSSRVRRHLPTARQMGLFGRLSCRKLSQCSRQLRSGLLTPSGGVRVVPCLEF